MQGGKGENRCKKNLTTSNRVKIYKKGLVFWLFEEGEIKSVFIQERERGKKMIVEEKREKGGRRKWLLRIIIVRQ